MATSEYQRIAHLVKQLSSREKLALAQEILSWVQSETNNTPPETSEDSPPKGSLMSLARHAEQFATSFDDTDLSENTREFMRTEFVEAYEKRMKHNEPKYS